jgi:uncharacterized protein YqjF (DUF2071 family)
MNVTRTIPKLSYEPSATARRRLHSHWGEPLFHAAWQPVLMLHFEVDAAALQRDVPFQLDLHENRAYVSLVAFSMRNMRPARGGKIAAWFFRPIATHDFLNVRTYVRHGGEPGIHFLAEWLSSRLATKLGPPIFGLPYRHGYLKYEHDRSTGTIRGEVSAGTNEGKLMYTAETNDIKKFQPCAAGSLTEWLMERYTAFNSAGGHPRFFRVWHPPWPQHPVKARILDHTLLTHGWPWFAQARLLGANFSPGFSEVWMGRPHLVTTRPDL